MARARVRKESGGSSPGAVDGDRRGDEAAGGAPGDAVERSAETETSVEKDQGGDTPPWPVLVAATIPQGVPVESPLAAPEGRGPALLAACVAKDDTLMVWDGMYPVDVPKAKLVAEMKRERGGALLGADDTDEARDAFKNLNCFKVEGCDRLFAATYDLPEVRGVTKVDPRQRVGKPFAGFQNFDACVSSMVEDGRSEDAARRICGKLQSEAEKSAAPTEKAAEPEWACREVKILSKAEEAEERIVLGVVLEPDGVDAQNDTISADEIRVAAHKFMEDFGNIGLQHQTFINGKARILESFIAPADFEINGQTVKKGTWLMSMRVLDDDIWKAVKQGLITGFSIGGSAVRLPDGKHA